MIPNKSHILFSPDVSVYGIFMTKKLPKNPDSCVINVLHLCKDISQRTTYKAILSANCDIFAQWKPWPDCFGRPTSMYHRDACVFVELGEAAVSCCDLRMLETNTDGDAWVV